MVSLCIQCIGSVVKQLPCLGTDLEKLANWWQVTRRAKKKKLKLDFAKKDSGNVLGYLLSWLDVLCVWVHEFESFIKQKLIN